MRVVVARVVERASLEALSPRLDRVERRGITMVPRDGVRVVQKTPPATAAPPVTELAAASG
jgi:hypothetical protein